MKKMNMEDYIVETPAMIKKNIENRKQLVKPLLDEYNKDEYTSIVLIASGSSYNACISARLFMQETLKKEVRVITPYTYEHYENTFYDHPFICVISQSGCSTNAIRAIEKLKEKGHEVIGITANEDSDFYDGICDHVVNYGIGIETVGYVTKGMVGLVLYFILFAIEAAGIRNIDGLDQLAEVYEDNYKQAQKFYQDHEKELLRMEKVYVVSAGYNYGCALEGALKIGETVKVPAFAYEIEEFIHGPNLQLSPGYTVFFIDNNDEASNHVVDVYEATKEVSDACYILSLNPRLKENAGSDKSIAPALSVIKNLSFFEYISFRVTETLYRWNLHPLMKKFDNHVKSKSEKYKDDME